MKRKIPFGTENRLVVYRDREPSKGNTIGERRKEEPIATVLRGVRCHTISLLLLNRSFNPFLWLLSAGNSLKAQQPRNRITLDDVEAACFSRNTRMTCCPVGLDVKIRILPFSIAKMFVALFATNPRMWHTRTSEYCPSSGGSMTVKTMRELLKSCQVKVRRLRAAGLIIVVSLQGEEQTMPPFIAANNTVACRQ